MVPGILGNTGIGTSFWSKQQKDTENEPLVGNSKTIIKRQCMCELGHACYGTSAAFAVMNDKRGQFVRISHDDYEKYCSYLRPRKGTELLPTTKEEDYYYVAAHHFDPSTPWVGQEGDLLKLPSVVRMWDEEALPTYNFDKAHMDLRTAMRQRLTQMQKAQDEKRELRRARRKEMVEMATQKINDSKRRASARANAVLPLPQQQQQPQQPTIQPSSSWRIEMKPTFETAQEGEIEMFIDSDDEREQQHDEEKHGEEKQEGEGIEVEWVANPATQSKSIAPAPPASTTQPRGLVIPTTNDPPAKTSVPASDPPGLDATKPETRIKPLVETVDSESVGSDAEPDYVNPFDTASESQPPTNPFGESTDAAAAAAALGILESPTNREVLVETQPLAHDPQSVLYFIHMLVVSAKVPNVDGLFDKSDPYVEVQVGNLVDKTPVIENDLEPVWNHNMAFTVAEMPETFTARVMDRNSTFEDAYIGKSEVTCGDYFDADGNNTFNGEVVIKDENNAAVGTLRLNFTCETIKKDEKKTEPEALADSPDDAPEEPPPIADDQDAESTEHAEPPKAETESRVPEGERDVPPPEPAPDEEEAESPQPVDPLKAAAPERALDQSKPGGEEPTEKLPADVATKKDVKSVGATTGEMARSVFRPKSTSDTKQQSQETEPSEWRNVGRAPPESLMVEPSHEEEDIRNLLRSSKVVVEASDQSSFESSQRDNDFDLGDVSSTANDERSLDSKPKMIFVSQAESEKAARGELEVEPSICYHNNPKHIAIFYGCMLVLALINVGYGKVLKHRKLAEKGLKAPKPISIDAPKPSPAPWFWPAPKHGEEVNPAGDMFANQTADEDLSSSTEPKKSSWFWRSSPDLADHDPGGNKTDAADDADIETPQVEEEASEEPATKRFSWFRRSAPATSPINEGVEADNQALSDDGSVAPELEDFTPEDGSEAPAPPSKKSWFWGSSPAPEKIFSDEEISGKEVPGDSGEATADTSSEPAQAEEDNVRAEKTPPKASWFSWRSRQESAESSAEDEKSDLAGESVQSGAEVATGEDSADMEVVTDRDFTGEADSETSADSTTANSKSSWFWGKWSSQPPGPVVDEDAGATDHSDADGEDTVAKDITAGEADESVVDDKALTNDEGVVEDPVPKPEETAPSKSSWFWSRPSTESKDPPGSAETSHVSTGELGSESAGHEGAAEEVEPETDVESEGPKGNESTATEEIINSVPTETTEAPSKKSWFRRGSSSESPSAIDANVNGTAETAEAAQAEKANETSVDSEASSDTVNDENVDPANDEEDTDISQNEVHLDTASSVTVSADADGVLKEDEAKSQKKSWSLWRSSAEGVEEADLNNETAKSPEEKTQADIASDESTEVVDEAAEADSATEVTSEAPSHEINTAQSDSTAHNPETIPDKAKMSEAVEASELDVDTPQPASEEKEGNLQDSDKESSAVADDQTEGAPLGEEPKEKESSWLWKKLSRSADTAVPHAEDEGKATMTSPSTSSSVDSSLVSDTVDDEGSAETLSSSARNLLGREDETAASEDRSDSAESVPQSANADPADHTDVASPEMKHSDEAESKKSWFSWKSKTEEKAVEAGGVDEVATSTHPTSEIIDQDASDAIIVEATSADLEDCQGLPASPELQVGAEESSHEHADPVLLDDAIESETTQEQAEEQEAIEEKDDSGNEEAGEMDSIPAPAESVKQPTWQRVLRKSPADAEDSLTPEVGTSSLGDEAGFVGSENIIQEEENLSEEAKEDQGGDREVRAAGTNEAASSVHQDEEGSAGGWALRGSLRSFAETAKSYLYSTPEADQPGEAKETEGKEEKPGVPSSNDEPDENPALDAEGISDEMPGQETQPLPDTRKFERASPDESHDDVLDFDSEGDMDSSAREIIEPNADEVPVTSGEVEKADLAEAAPAKESWSSKLRKAVKLDSAADQPKAGPPVEGEKASEEALSAEDTVKAPPADNAKEEPPILEAGTTQPADTEDLTGGEAHMEEVETTQAESAAETVDSQEMEEAAAADPSHEDEKENAMAEEVSSWTKKIKQAVGLKTGEQQRVQPESPADKNVGLSQVEIPTAQAETPSDEDQQEQNEVPSDVAKEPEPEAESLEDKEHVAAESAESDATDADHGSHETPADEQTTQSEDSTKGGSWTSKLKKAVGLESADLHKVADPVEASNEENLLVEQEVNTSSSEPPEVATFESELGKLILGEPQDEEEIESKEMMPDDDSEATGTPEPLGASLQDEAEATSAPKAGSSDLGDGEATASAEHMTPSDDATADKKGGSWTSKLKKIVGLEPSDEIPDVDEPASQEKSSVEEELKSKPVNKDFEEAKEVVSELIDLIETIDDEYGADGVEDKKELSPNTDSSTMQEPREQSVMKEESDAAAEAESGAATDLPNGVDSDGTATDSDAEPADAGILGKWKGMADSLAAKYTKSAPESGEIRESDAKTSEAEEPLDSEGVVVETTESENESDAVKNKETVDDQEEVVGEKEEEVVEQTTAEIDNSPQEEANVQEIPASESKEEVVDNSTSARVKGMLKNGLVRWYNSGFALESVLLVSGAYCYWGRG